MERSRPGGLFRQQRGLSRRVARGPGQRESGGGIDLGLPAFARGNAIHEKCRHGVQSTQLRGPANPMKINLKRTTVTLHPDHRRVLIRPFNLANNERAIKICARVMALPESEVQALLAQVLAEFDERHPKIRDFLKRRFDQARPWLPTDQKLSEERELLIGAYFTHEYSFEAAALFNPSMVPHPDQSGLAPGAQRFVLSLRGTGEGHISSITFRTGVVGGNGNVVIDAPGRYSLGAARIPNARI